MCQSRSIRDCMAMINYNMKVLVLVIVCVVNVQLVNAKSLEMPSYLKACVYNDPDFNACAVKSARDAIPFIVKGDRKYHIPIMDPMEITNLQVNEGVLGLSMTLSNMKVYGMKLTHVNSIEVDWSTNVTRCNITIPRVEVNTDYEINGKILILPISGTGHGNITVTDLALSYSYDIDLIKKKDGKRYAVPKDGQMELSMSRIYIKLENLFNGNKLLGDQMNVFMNENWRDLMKDIGPVIKEAVSESFGATLKNIFDLISFDKAIIGVPN